MYLSDNIGGTAAKSENIGGRLSIDGFYYQDLKSSLLIVSFAILDSSVVGLIFINSAAPFMPRMRPCTFLRIEMIYSLSVSLELVLHLPGFQC